MAQAATVEERLERLEQKTLSVSPGAQQETGNMVFFRGGGVWATSDRSGEVETDVFGFNGRNSGDSGYYVGAGLDLVLTRDIWDLFPGTWALGEIGVEFKRFDSKKVQQAVPTTCDFATGGAACTGSEIKKKKSKLPC